MYYGKWLSGEHLFYSAALKTEPMLMQNFGGKQGALWSRWKRSILIVYISQLFLEPEWALSQ